MRRAWVLVFAAVGASWFPVCAARGQEMAEDVVGADELVSLPLEDVVPEVRPQIPRAATRPTTQPEPEAQKEYLLDDPWGARTWLIEHGITPGAMLTLEMGKNVSGGRTTRGSAFNELLNLSLELDTEKLLGWEGGKAYVLYQHQRGTSASDEAGDLQGVFSTDADGRSQLSEAWYQQVIVKDKWLVKAGKIDAEGEFAFSDFAAPFMNGGMAVPLSNPFMPAYPDQALGIDTFVYLTKHVYLGAGVFDGSVARGVRTGENSPRSAWRSPGDVYAIGEAGATWQVTESKLSGRVKVGAWYQDGSALEKFSGGTAGSTWGPYVVVDQQVWRANPRDEGDDRGVGFFVVYDHADKDVQEVADHVSAGLNWKGPMASRPADVVGAGVSFAGLSDRAGFRESSETAWEGFYSAQLTPWIVVQPDVQYVANPGGGAHHDAVVVAVRIEITF